MTIYRTTLHLDSGRRFDGLLVIHSRRWPTWSMIHEQIKKRLAEIANQMDEDDRDDYEKLAARRSALREMQKVFPKALKHVNEDDLPIAAGIGLERPRAVVAEIKVV